MFSHDTRALVAWERLLKISRISLGNDNNNNACYRLLFSDRFLWSKHVQESMVCLAWISYIIHCRFFDKKEWLKSNVKCNVSIRFWPQRVQVFPQILACLPTHNPLTNVYAYIRKHTFVSLNYEMNPMVFLVWLKSKNMTGKLLFCIVCAFVVISKCANISVQ